MRELLRAALVGVLVTLMHGCATHYTGTYKVAGHTENPDEVAKLQMAEKIREAFLIASEELGLDVFEVNYSQPGQLIPGLRAEWPAHGIKSPFSKLSGNERGVRMVAGFYYPFYIAIRTGPGTDETALVKEIRRRLEDRLNGVEPKVVFSFKISPFQLD